MDKACRKCRREGKKLFLKGERCNGPKCPFTRRSYAPGQHGQGFSSRPSEYGRQLREKQTAARIYGVREKVFRNYFKKASKSLGKTDERLIQILESRLDNVVFRAGFAASRAQARQLIVHGHVQVNDVNVNIPSFSVKAGDKISFRDKFKKSGIYKERSKIIEKSNVAKWIKADKKALTMEILHIPSRDELEVPFDPALVIEFYSR